MQLAAGNLGRADDQLNAVERGVETGDARRVTGRRNEGEAVRREEGLVVDLGGVGGLLHGGLVRGGQDIDVCTLAELGDQVLRPGEVETDIDVRVGGLEGGFEFLEGLGQRGGGVDVENDLAGGDRCVVGRGRGVGGGGRAGGAGGEGQGGSTHEGEEAEGTHRDLLLRGD